MSRKRRWILTPDEALEMAKAAYECKFGTNQQPKLEVNKPMPTLLPRPIRMVPIPKGQGVSISVLRKAQKAERQRARFDKKVRKNLSRSVRKLTKIQREQIRAAKVAYRAAVKQQRELAQKALKIAERAKQAAEALRKQVQAAREWLRLEALRQRNLDRAAKERIRKARACGFRLLSICSSQEWQWGDSCPLFAIRGLATAAAAIWAAEQAK